ncbi:MAG TPA: DNA polymerase/3'-5' exonuclease PolX [Candidatus Eremiobacteraceae bacterium]|nr:DNA polymerase/3'-5' exonuclease PolX [Candidatus Eremiobacteraceae bacterium]
MTNDEIASRLNEIAALMEFDGEPFFKTKAYQRAARSVEDSETTMRALIDSGELLELPGVGKAIAQKIDDIDRTGTCKYLEELRAKFPPTILELIRVPSVGTKTAIALYKELGITSIAELRLAVDDGSISKLPRLGPKSIENLKASLARLADRTKRMRLGDAWPLARSIVEALTAHSDARNVVAAGSLRRMEPTVGDIDIICTSDSPAEVLAYFTKLPVAQSISGLGDTKATIWAEPGISVDCRVVKHECFGNLLQHFTGNKDHNVKLRELARSRGLKVSEYGIESLETHAVMTAQTEEEVYATLGLSYIPPELRLGLDEIDLARAGKVPTLVELADIRGDLHDHTDWSDGSRTIEEMARAAAQRGRSYLSISDHSRGRAVANGLSIDRLREQIALIKSVRDAYGVRLLCSSEVDIRADGSMDFPDEVLAELDIVVGSIHSAFTGSKEKQTERLIRAIRNPYVNVIGHPTGALLEQRTAYEFDVDAVFRAAAETGTALEINANPARLDLDANLSRRARELGCTLSIDTDAHSTDMLDDMFYGVGTARKAGLTKENVLNARPVEGVLEFVAAKRR